MSIPRRNNIFACAFAKQKEHSNGLQAMELQSPWNTDQLGARISKRQSAIGTEPIPGIQTQAPPWTQRWASSTRTHLSPIFSGASTHRMVRFEDLQSGYASAQMVRTLVVSSTTIGGPLRNLSPRQPPRKIWPAAWPVRRPSVRNRALGSYRARWRPLARLNPRSLHQWQEQPVHNGKSSKLAAHSAQPTTHNGLRDRRLGEKP